MLMRNFFLNFQLIDRKKLKKKRIGNENMQITIYIIMYFKTKIDNYKKYFVYIICSFYM